MTYSTLNKLALTLSISIVALNFSLNAANAATHCSKVTQNACTTANLCKWKEGHTKGTPTKSNPKKMYKRNAKASCRKDTAAINAYILTIPKFNNLPKN